MIRYNVNPVDPLGSVMKGYSNALAIKSNSEAERDREIARKQQQEQYDYNMNVLRPQQQEDRNYLVKQRQELDTQKGLEKQAQSILGILAQTPEPKAVQVILDDLKANNPDVLPSVLTGYSEIRKQQIEAIKAANEEGQKFAFAAVSLNLNQFPNFAKNLAEKYPDVANALPMEVRTEEDLDRFKQAVSLMQLSDSKKAEYMLARLGGDGVQTNQEKPLKSTDLNKIHNQQQQRYDEALQQYKMSGADGAKEGGWFSSEVKGKPFMSFDEFNRQDMHQGVYQQVYGGDSYQGSDNQEQSWGDQAFSELLNVAKGGQSQEMPPQGEDGVVIQPQPLPGTYDQPSRMATPQKQEQNGAKETAQKIAAVAAKTGSVALQKVVEKAESLVDKGASSSEIASVKRDFERVMKPISSAKNDLSSELSTVWQGVIADWNRLMAQIKGDTTSNNALVREMK